MYQNTEKVGVVKWRVRQKTLPSSKTMSSETLSVVMCIENASLSVFKTEELDTSVTNYLQIFPAATADF